MTEMKALPPDAESLVLELDEAFPARCITPHETLEQHLRYAGKRELVDWLLHLLKRTEEA